MTIHVDTRPDPALLDRLYAAPTIQDAQGFFASRHYSVSNELALLSAPELAKDPLAYRSSPDRSLHHAAWLMAASFVRINMILGLAPHIYDPEKPWTATLRAFHANSLAAASSGVQGGLIMCNTSGMERCLAGEPGASHSPLTMMNHVRHTTSLSLRHASALCRGV